MNLPTLPTDTFRCESYRCTLSAQACLERQAARRRAARWTAPLHPLCGAKEEGAPSPCAQGRAVREAVGPLPTRPAQCHVNTFAPFTRPAAQKPAPKPAPQKPAARPQAKASPKSKSLPKASATNAAQSPKARVTPEQRRDIMRRVHEAFMAQTTPEERRELARRRWLSKTPEERSAIARKREAKTGARCVTPECTSWVREPQKGDRCSWCTRRGKPMTAELRARRLEQTARSAKKKAC